MGAADDSVLSEYITESREHLADIESDLLTMEGMGAQIDEALVNKVFRAAHSIKGGAGFLGLPKIQELAHKIENNLDMIRSREMVPNPEVINILLIAFDKLKAMLDNHEQSAQEDITDLVVSLTGLASTHLPPEQKASLTKEVKLADLGYQTLIKISEFDLQHARKGGNYIYLVKYDLIHDVHRMGKTPLSVIKNLESGGTIIDCALDFQTVGTLDDEPMSSIPFHVLHATIMDQSLAQVFFEVPQERIHLIEDRTEAAKPASASPTADAAPNIIPTEAPKAQAVQPLAAQTQTGQSEASPQQGQTGAVETTLRVGVGLLEQLMTLAGELVLSRNQLVEAIAKSDQRLIHASSQHINLVTSELQETIMLTRMQPVGNVLNKFPRVVRDMARGLGKEIRLEITGQDTEMDKTLIEGLSDPLTHMVRNAVDHGIEPADERSQAGKDRTGTIRIKASHEAGQVVISIADDGKGIDPEKISSAAINKGLIAQDSAKIMSDKEKMALVFLPGLSTAQKVSDISGRGVGMDVVKTNLDKLGGKVEITSEKGKGTTFTIKLPLTLAIIPSLLMSVGMERYSIPQVSVSELIRIPAEQVKKRIEVVGSSEVLLLRGNLIPIIRLADALGVMRTYCDGNGVFKQDRRERIADRRSPRYTLTDTSLSDDAHDDNKNGRTGNQRRFHAVSDLNIVVVDTGIMQYGLVVDELHDTSEIVVKPIGRHLKHLHEYAGTTILGDGQVALILDVSGLAVMSGLTSVSGSARSQELVREADAEQLQDMHTFLTFRNSPKEVCAVPLELVSRIEQIDRSQVETIGNKRTMQYRGASLPLVTLHDAAQVNEIAPDQPLVVIVFTIGGREVGLLAAMPVDVVETNAAVDQVTLRQKGVMGSAIIKGDTIMILDIFDLVDAIHPEWIDERRQDRPAAEGVTILLAEDSDFFRNQVTKFIESDGYKVIAAEDGQAAWELLQKNPDKVSLVVTDVEMPRLTGLGLTQNIRADKRFDKLPIIALSSLASEDDMARGRAAGVNDYQVKLDKENLLAGIRRFLDQSAEVNINKEN
jgi:two-component system chemotaxis sensor kinase CheA